jgi:hypothetical protein
MDLLVEFSLGIWVGLVLLLESRFSATSARRTPLRTLTLVASLVGAAAFGFTWLKAWPQVTTGQLAPTVVVQAIYLATWVSCALFAAKRGLVGFSILGSTALALYASLSI